MGSKCSPCLPLPTQLSIAVCYGWFVKRAKTDVETENNTGDEYIGSHTLCVPPFRQHSTYTALQRPFPSIFRHIRKQQSPTLLDTYVHFFCLTWICWPCWISFVSSVFHNGTTNGPPTSELFIDASAEKRPMIHTHTQRAMGTRCVKGYV